MNQVIQNMLRSYSSQDPQKQKQRLIEIVPSNHRGKFPFSHNDSLKIKCEVESRESHLFVIR
jgi:hypothetical protein